MRYMKIFISCFNFNNLFKNNEINKIDNLRCSLIDINNSFIEISNDFLSMEVIFIKTFEKLLEDYYPNLLDEIVTKLSGNKNKGGIFDVMKNKWKKSVIPTIFLKNFLLFYDEYSYNINYKIMKTNILQHEFIIKISNIIENTDSILFSKQKYLELDNFLQLKYFDIFYFLRLLEEIVNKWSDLNIFKIRNLIYKDIYFISFNDIYLDNFYEDIYKWKTQINKQCFFYSKFITEKATFSEKLKQEELKSFYSLIFKPNHIFEAYNYYLTIKSTNNIRFKIIKRIIRINSNGIYILNELYKKSIVNILYFFVCGKVKIKENIIKDCYEFISYKRSFKGNQFRNFNFQGIQILKKTIKIFNNKIKESIALNIV